MRVGVDSEAYRVLVGDLERRAGALRCDGRVVVPGSVDVRVVKRFGEVLDRLEGVIDSYADLGVSDAGRFRVAGDVQVERDRLAAR